MSSDLYEFRWPDEHVAWHGFIEADEEYGIPFRTEVFVFHENEHLEAAVQRKDVNGFSSLYHEVDDAGVGALLLLEKEWLTLSVIAHEVYHLVLTYFGHMEESRIGARRWLVDHPEQIAIMGGNYTQQVWFGIPTAEQIDSGELTDTQS